MGKWRGAFRLVPWLAAFSAVQLALYVCLCPAQGGPRLPPGVGWKPQPLILEDRVWTVVIPTAQVLAAGGLFASLGVLLGVLVEKPGRAIAWNVTAFFALSVGWIMFVELGVGRLLRAFGVDRYNFTNGRPNWTAQAIIQGLVAGSPYAGQILPLEIMFYQAAIPRPVFWRTFGLVVFLTGLLAAGLLALAVKVFDRRLGRVPLDAPAGPRAADARVQTCETGAAGRRARPVVSVAHAAHGEGMIFMGLVTGPGPVFVYEAITATRRLTPYLLRSAFVAALLVGLYTVWESRFSSVPASNDRESLRQLAELGRYFFEYVSVTQISLVLLAGPALTAGSVCLDRGRGTLSHVLVTDLTATEIVLGKLCSRLLTLFSLIACAIPFVAICAMFGGISAEALVGLTVVSVSCAVLGCSAAMALSVRSTKTHEVLMAVYAAMLAWVFSPGAVQQWNGSAPPWFEKLNPYALAAAAYFRPGFATPVDWLVFAGVYLGLSLGLVVFSVRGLRKDVDQPAARLDRLYHVLERAAWRLSRRSSPSLDADPVYWREWHRGRPSRLARRLRLLYFIVAAVAGSASLLITATDRGATGRSSNALTNSLMTVNSLGLLFVAVIAPTSLSEDRVRGSLDVLMSTPLTTRSIVVGKWRGAFRLVPWLAANAAVQLALFAYVCPEHGNSPGTRFGMGTPSALTAQERVLAVVIPTAQVLAAGALFASVGVFFGVLINKPGRAIAWSVAAYLALTVGWIWFVNEVVTNLLVSGLRAWYATSDQTALRGFFDVRDGLLAASPLVALSMPVYSLTYFWTTPRYVMWRTFGGVVVLTALLAIALLALTVAIFDRRLGRVPENPSAKPRGPDPTRNLRKRSRPTPEVAHSPR